MLAIVVALSTTATAAMIITGKQIKDHSITGKDIKKKTLKGKHLHKRSVGAKHLRKGAVRTKHIRNGTIRGKDIRNNSISSSQIRNGSVSLSELSTTVVNQLDGASGFQVVTKRQDAAAPLLAPVEVSAACPAGKVAIGADGWWDGNTNLAPPQVRRTSAAGYAAESAFPLDLLGGQTLVLQVTCLSTR